MVGDERRVTRAESRPQRVLVVRCPAWLAADQGHQPGKDRQPGKGGPGRAAGQDEAGYPAAGPEKSAFEQVVNAVREFCPQVETVRSGICAVSARGPARYFRGEAELARKIAEAVTCLGHDCKVGIADGLYAALLAAKVAGTGSPAAEPAGRAGPGSGRAGPGSDRAPGSGRAGEAGTDSVRPRDGPGPAGAAGEALPVVIVPHRASSAFLAPHPVAVLGQPELTDVLSRLGIRTLGEFAALPEGEVENRFGSHGLSAHRLARGLDPRPLAVQPPPADLSVQIEFDPAARQSEPVVFAAKSLASQLHARLAASGLVCVRIQVQVICADGQEITRSWRHDGLLSELAVAERVRWQLDGWRPDQHDGVPESDRSAGHLAADLVPAELVPAELEPAELERSDLVPAELEPAELEPAELVPAELVPAELERGDLVPAELERGDLVPGETDAGVSDAGVTDGRVGAVAGRYGPDHDADLDGGTASGGVVLLRLIPDQLVHDQGRQLGLWGEALVSGRVARAAVRVQAMLGHAAVRQPLLAGGRGPAEQALLVPFGDAQIPRLPTDRPWPGKLPAPAPTTVYPVPRPVGVTDSTGEPVTVTGRGQPSGSPARLSMAAGASVAITAWTGPWPVNERWWDPVHACRKARFQLVTEDGGAWLAVVKDGRWLIEASYD